MRHHSERIDRDDLLNMMSRRINQAVYRVNVGLTFTDGEAFVEEDLSSLTVQEILAKISDFLSTNPLDEHYIVFLHYLGKYPVSMCKRQVSNSPEIPDRIPLSHWPNV